MGFYQDCATKATLEIVSAAFKLSDTAISFDAHSCLIVTQSSMHNVPMSLKHFSHTLHEPFHGYDRRSHLRVHDSTSHEPQGRNPAGIEYSESDTYNTINTYRLNMKKVIMAYHLG
jgi:hypothetical protein